MRFSDWGFLFLIVLIPLLIRLWLRRNQPPRMLFSLPIESSASSKASWKWWVWLKAAVLVLLIAALARPQSGFRKNIRTLSGVDIVLVLDVSASMNIEDLADRSRLDVAKDTIESFVRGRQDDRIGFVMFSGEPLTMAPPTLDYGMLMKSLHDAQVGVLKDGTAIGDGLSVAVRHLRASEAKSKVIILLTDGDNNVGQVDPATAGELARGYGIRVYTIAIGREGRVRMPIRRKGVFGQTITTYQWFDNALNPELLTKIAESTQGKFYRVTDESTLASVFREIDRLERSEVQSEEKVRYEEEYELPLKLALLLLILGQILERTWWRVLP